MMRRVWNQLRHASAMVKKTAKNYFMLSMTVVLSFTILLVYLMFSDSVLYNRYKEVMSQPAELVMTSDDEITEAQRQALVYRISKTGDSTHYVITRYAPYTLAYKNEGFSTFNTVYSMPSSVWGIFETMERKQITWLDGRETNDVTLGEKEALISQMAYDLLGLAQQENPMYPIKTVVQGEDGEPVELLAHAKVVGIIENASADHLVEDPSNGGQRLDENIYVSNATMESILQDRQPMAEPEKDMVFYSRTPQKVDTCLREMGIACQSVFDVQNLARHEMYLSAQSKGITTMVLYILLGINLYGSFSNTLEKRKFEVGVKRAIGASKTAIIGQFLWEGMLVMAVNILIAVALAVNCLIGYKYCIQKLHHSIWTITLSGWSIGMFAVISITLIIVFSMIFAVKTTQVDVVDYLKSE